MKCGYLFYTAVHKVLQDHHMPFEFHAEENVVQLFHSSFINYYSKLRKTPMFTTERLKGNFLKVNQQCIYIYVSSPYNCRAEYQQTEMKLNGSELILG